MESVDINGLQALATLVSGPLAGWVVAYCMDRRMEKKDDALMKKHDQHIVSLESHIDTQKKDTDACNARFELLLQRVFHLEDKKADKTE